MPQLSHTALWSPPAGGVCSYSTAPSTWFEVCSKVSTPSIALPSPLPGLSVGGAAGAKTMDATMATMTPIATSDPTVHHTSFAAAALGELLLVLRELLLALLLALLLHGLGDLRLRGGIAARLLFDRARWMSGSCV